MNCRKAIRQLPAYLDRELTEGERKEVKQHLGVCLFCSTELSALRTTSRMLDSWDAASPRRSRVADVIGQVRAEEQGVLHAHRNLWAGQLTVLALRAAAVFVFLAGSVMFSAHFTGENGAEKISAGLDEKLQPGGGLIALDEDVRQNYIKPSEFWLAVRGMEDRARPAWGYPWDNPLRAVTSDGVPGSSVRLPVVDHTYFPGEGMPVESIIPMGGP